MLVKGSQRFAVLLCKFRDSDAEDPHPESFYEDLVANRDTGGLNDYWIAASANSINLNGSSVFGWRTLDTTRLEFLAAHPGRGDKVQGAIAAFNIDATEYVGVIAIFNADMGDGGAAGSGILAQAGDANVTFLAHEMGHVMGLDHSFDTSNRKAISWSAEGEYFDEFDMMSAMGVRSDHGHDFSPRGPLVNVPNMVRMGWMPPERVWRPMGNSSKTYEIDIVALGHPEIGGYLAAQGNGWIAEFRIPAGFDAGLTRPTVLFHNDIADPNSVIRPSDSVNHLYEWQPGQVFGNAALFARFGGVRVTVLSFDLQRKVARLRVHIKAARPPFVDPDVLFGLGIGRLPHEGQLLVVKNGKIVPMPVPEPELAFDGPTQIRAQIVDIVRSELSAQLSELRAGAETRFV